MKKIGLLKNKLSSFMSAKPKKVIVIFFGIILLIGIFSYSFYGMSWDEEIEVNTMLSNAKPYVHLFGGDSAVKNIGLENYEYISTSVERDHGTAIYYITAPLLLILKGDNYRDFYTLRHLYTFLVYFASLICLYFLIKNLTKRRIYAIAGVFMMFLSPRIFAESFYNSKDIILMSLCIISLYFGYKLIETQKIKYGILFALASAFAANARIIGFWLIALVGLLYIIMIIYNAVTQKKITFKPILAGIICMISFILIFIAITPATWDGLFKYLDYSLMQSVNFVRWQGFVLYQGDIYNNTFKPLPWHYVPVIFAITTPIVTVLLVIFGLFNSIKNTITKKIKKIFEDEQKYYIIMLLFILVPVISSIVKKSTLYNGWRHFYFIYGPLVILAVGGLKTLIEIKKPSLKKVIIGVVVAQFVFSVSWIAFHPFLQFAYYNPLAINHQDNYEHDYWNVSATKCLIDLTKNTDDKIIKITSMDYYSYDGLQKAIKFLPKKYSERFKLYPIGYMPIDEDVYVLCNPTYQSLLEREYKQGYSPQQPFQFKLVGQPYCTIKVNGADIMQIYKFKKL